MFLNSLYYHLRPIIPRRIQIALRRWLTLQKRLVCANTWPIDINAGVAPIGSPKWPNHKRFALLLTHDIETTQGQDNSWELIKMEEELGFRSAFNFVPKRYKVSEKLRHYLSDNGFEVGVHGLYHDGKLYHSRKVFMKRMVKINRYLKEWNAVGFRSPSMHSNLKWIHNLEIEYDSSTFDTDPFEPQSEGVGMIFPFMVSQNSSSYVELPYTLPQDSTLFVIMKEKSIDIWKKKLDWIAEKGGMALLTTHPDYMKFGGGKCGIDEYSAEYYAEFLGYLKERYDGQYWHVLPKDMAKHWVKNFG